MENNKYFEYILLFNMLNLNYYKNYAKTINEMGMESAFCEAWDFHIDDFAQKYELDYAEFREALAPSFNFHINWFIEHPEIEVSNVIKKEV